MFRRSSPLALVIVLCLALQTNGFSQQFRSTHRLIVSPSSASTGYSDPVAIIDFNGDGRPDR